MKMLRRLNSSYQRLTRNRHVFARNLELTDKEYRLWDLLIALYDWDSSHEDTYGTVRITQYDVADILNTSPASANRSLKSLLAKGLIYRIDRSLYKVYPLEYSEKIIAPAKKDNSSTKSDISYKHQFVSSMQQKRGYEADSSLVSYKDKNKFSSLSDDDKRWIHENLKEG